MPETVGRHGACMITIYVLVNRSVACLDNGSRDICEGGQYIALDSLVIRVVLHDPPEVKVFVKLEAGTAA